jgi:hypothetical protein
MFLALALAGVVVAVLGRVFLVMLLKLFVFFYDNSNFTLQT